METWPGHTAGVGDTCKRIAPSTNSLKRNKTYVITKVNLVSARGVREDGRSINQSLKSIVVVKRAPISKITLFIEKVNRSYKAMKAIWK